MPRITHHASLVTHVPRPTSHVPRPIVLACPWGKRERDERETVISAGRARARVRARADGVFFGWWIVAASAGIQLLQAGLLMQAYGAYVSVLRDEFGWSKTALS